MARMFPGVIVALAGALGSLPASAADETLAVAPVAGDPDAARARTLQRDLEEAAGALGHRVAGAEWMALELDAAKGMGVDCSARAPACLARVAAFTGIPLVLIPTLDTRSDGERLRLVVYDGTADQRVREVSVKLSSGGPDRSAGVVAATRAALRGDALEGRVLLEGAFEGGDLLVDGQPGRLEDLAHLAPGPHTVEVAGVTEAATVDVYAGVTRSLTLKPLPPPSSEQEAGPAAGPADQAPGASEGASLFWLVPAGLAGASLIVGGVALAAASGVGLAWDPKIVGVDTYNNLKLPAQIGFLVGVAVGVLSVLPAVGFGGWAAWELVGGE